MRIVIKSKRQFDKTIGKRILSPIVQWLYKSLFSIQRDASQYTPVDTGLLRASLWVQVDEDKLEGQVGYLKGKSGKALSYAIYVHEGTRKHFLPFDPFKYPGFVRWGIRHGFDVSKGGLMVGGYANPFLQRGLNENLPLIRSELATIRIEK